MPLILPQGYKPLLNKYETEQGIKLIKEFFQDNLSTGLHLRRVTGPLFVQSGLGINDDLSGKERPVRFPIKCMGDAMAEVVHSLAKWKRLTLGEFNVKPGYGIYTDMNAIRADEDLDNLHSLYVDQWDWEQTITAEQRTLEYLKKVVKNIYYAMRRTEFLICERFPQLQPSLVEKVTFVHSEELLQRWPDKTPHEREDLIAREHGSVFIVGIGAPLSNGVPHDMRAPDYDDYTTLNSDGYQGLNGDLIVWNEVLGRSFEISSMGIRVDKAALLRQLAESHQQERLELYFHQRLMADTLPLSIGGGIGQSRLCMLYLKKAHIGEIQASIWPEPMREECRKAGIPII